MVMIQDSNVPSHQEKPLRITGDPNKCQVWKIVFMYVVSGIWKLAISDHY